MKALRHQLSAAVYSLCLLALAPLNRLLAWWRPPSLPHSVLHISYMVHIPWQTVEILRRHGMRADYLALGRSKVWNRSDYQHQPSRWPVLLAVQEFLLFWRVVARYECVHLHFGLTMTRSGWELPLLKRMGRRIIVHWRGCEIRDRARNTALHPAMNICQQCDYNAYCQTSVIRRRRERALRYGDQFLVTTPDLLDFAPDALHLPFFTPELVQPAIAINETASGVVPLDRRPLRIVHATNHPGIEGTAEIEAAIRRLQERGYHIEFVFLQGVPPERVLQEYRTADLAIGKMKMGYYANAQIESLACGVPAVTHLRPEFRTPELERSGLILTTLADLEHTLEHYLTHPDELAEKRRRARPSVLALHDNDRIAAMLIDLYGGRAAA